MQVNYLPSYKVARRLAVSPRCLSMLTGSFHVRLDEKRVDLGLCIKNAPRGLCVPDYAKPQPEQQGWLYSPSLLQLLEKYKVALVYTIKKGLGDATRQRTSSTASHGMLDLDCGWKQTSALEAVWRRCS